MRQKLYDKLVNQVPGIRQRYQERRRNTRGAGRIASWCALAGWNISYHVLGKKKKLEQGCVHAEESIKWDVTRSESEADARISPKALADRLGTFDVISFDVFDTLVFRPFSRPSDLFFETGRRLGYPDFERIRREGEEKARERKFRKSRSREVSLEEIWELMERETGIPAEPGRKTEWECELEFCFGNPYMLEVTRLLRKKGKKLIIASDMYLGQEYIRCLLEKCGYPPFDHYFVSCDCGVSKGDKGLFTRIKSRYGGKCTYAHVGDNRHGDGKMAKEAGFTPFLYPNVNEAGAPYRSRDMSAVTGSMYRGIVNSWLHNGNRIFSREYELGFVYGGLFVTGYCQFIRRYVRENQIEKVLFLSRDGDILKQAYELLYPDENTAYAYWSRKAGTILCAGYFKYDYFRRFLYHKVNQGYTLGAIFSSMKLSDMLDEFCREYSRSRTCTLSEATAKECRIFFMKNWERVLAHYKEGSEAGRRYYGKLLDGCRSALAADIGWAGSGAISLQYLAKHVWNLDCRIMGAVAGTNSAHNAEPDASEGFLQEGTLVSYLYSQRHNRDLWKFHDPGAGHNLYLEQLLCSPTPAFEGFSFDQEGRVKLLFGKKDGNEKAMREIQQGILDFVKAWIRHFGGDGPLSEISGRDAYGPLMVMLRNKGYLREIESFFRLDANVE